MKLILATLGTALLVVVAAYLIFVYSGVYNVAATDPHNDFVRWTLVKTTTNSIESHAGDVTVPANLSDSSMIRAGLRRFSEMCVMCHGAPGVERGFVGKGLLPEPPKLSEAVPMWSPTEEFWIVKHGLKYTGMPAFGPTHPDQPLWQVVAFIEQLPDMSAQEYKRLKAEVISSQRADSAQAGGSGGHTHSGASTTHSH